MGCAGERDEDGRRLVVHNGHARAANITGCPDAAGSGLSASAITRLAETWQASGPGFPRLLPAGEEPHTDLAAMWFIDAQGHEGFAQAAGACSGLCPCGTARDGGAPPKRRLSTMPGGA